MAINPTLNSLVLSELKSKVDHNVPTPLYYQLMVILKAMIDSGHLKNGDELPSEQEISAALDISRPTVRQCMQGLVNAGVIVRRKGKGTFVTHQKMEFNYIAKHESFHEIIAGYGYTPATHILEFEVVEPIPFVSQQLKIDDSEPLYSLLRLCMANDTPMLYCHTYLQASRFPGLQDFDFSKVSLYETLDRHYGTKVVTLKREIGADNAGQTDANMLQIKRGRAIFVVRNLAYDADNVPVEYSDSHYRSETIKFTNYMKC
ncbi:MAG: GntR family transcriptional regulator [Lachnospiraceae bacterium]|jgi:GntR family transcriptional regulator|nr:GntR family transcriptional regulator [Lachnospiraceae bacterium]